MKTVKILTIWMNTWMNSNCIDETGENSDTEDINVLE